MCVVAEGEAKADAAGGEDCEEAPADEAGSGKGFGYETDINYHGFSTRGLKTIGGSCGFRTF